MNKDEAPIVEKEQTEQDASNPNSAVTVPQVVHTHVNGLCVVTAGDVSTWLVPLYPNHTIVSIEMVAKEPPSCSAAEKRKRQSKMLRGGKVEHTVTPTTVIANLVLTKNDTSGETEGETVEVPLYAGVWGTIVELNHGVTPRLLMEDPLLDGYLAVILPSGQFPPPTTS